MAKKVETKELLGITLISESEKLVYQPYPEQAPHIKIHYRRTGEVTAKRFREKYITDDGKIDNDKFNEAVIEFGLVSWEYVFTPDHQLAPINMESLQGLDRWIIDELVSRIVGTKRGLLHNPLAG
jgi:hypothetical protein